MVLGDQNGQEYTGQAEKWSGLSGQMMGVAGGSHSGCVPSR